MAEKTAAETQREMDALRERDATGGVLKVPEPKHGNPTEAAPPAVGDTVIGVRVGSEAAVESGMGPVLPAGPVPGSEFTRVRNREMRERDEREFKKRGMRSDGRALAGTPISVSSEGVFVVEPQNAKELGVETKQFVSGGFTGQMPEQGLLIRPLTAKEEEERFAAPRQASQRSNDLVKGSGTGGGGNPMHAGDARGVSSATAERVGEGGVTSKSGPAPAPATTPQGGGTTSRNR